MTALIAAARAQWLYWQARYHARRIDRLAAAYAYHHLMLTVLKKRLKETPS